LYEWLSELNCYFSEHDALTGKYSANGIFFTMKHMKTMKKKLQYLHALHGENKKHQLLKNFVFPILKYLYRFSST